MRAMADQVVERCIAHMTSLGRQPACGDVDAAELCRSMREGAPERGAALEWVEGHMLNRDGGDHRRLRNLVSKAFTPRMIEQLRPRIQAIADELLDPIVADGEMELVSTFAFPLPITVIAELLGVPLADRDQFREWSDAFVRPAIDAAELERFGAQMIEFVAYLHALFEERRREPADDLTSALVAVEDGGDTLSEQELSSMVALLIVAGHETTVSLIGNATLALLTHPEQRAAIESDPSLLPRAVEELIRFDGPVERTLNRWAAEDVELRGQAIRRGESVIVILGSADRDPERFEEPDALDLASRRESRHLGFGRGSHFCLGAPLARLETEIALGRLLRRLPGLRLGISPENLRWRPVPLFRSLVELPVGWDAS
jgi:cytochrome P450